MSASSENTIRSIIESQKQELIKLAEEVNRLTQAYDAEKRKRMSLAERCTELERHIGSIPTGISPAATSRSHDSESFTRQLAYPQNREGLGHQQKNEYSDSAAGYQDNIDTQDQPQDDTTSWGYGYAYTSPPQQYPAQYYGNAPSPSYQNTVYAASPQDRPGSDFPGGFVLSNTRLHRSSMSSRRQTHG